MEAPTQALRNLGIPFEHAFASEIDASCIETIKANCAPAVLYGDGDLDGDITQRDNSTAPDCDCYVAGFPCQPFSRAGLGNGLADPRGTVFDACVAYITEKRPKFFLLENVKGLLHEDHEHDWRYIMKTLKAIPGYKISFKLMQPYDHGLPQSRERLYIVGLRDAAAPFEFPRPTQHISMANAVAAQRKLVDWSDTHPSNLGIKDGSVMQRARGYADVLKERGYGGCFFNALGMQFSKQDPVPKRGCPYASCVTAGGLIWCSPMHRWATQTELLRLQGFPDKYQLIGPPRERRQQLGNTMCVPVLEAIFSKLLADYPRTNAPITAPAAADAPITTAPATIATPDDHATDAPITTAPAAADAHVVTDTGEDVDPSAEGDEVHPSAHGTAPLGSPVVGARATFENAHVTNAHEHAEYVDGDDDGAGVEGGETVHPNAGGTAPLGSPVVGPRATVDPYRYLVSKPGCRLRIEWTKMGQTYDGVVEAAEGQHVLVSYRFDRRTVKHDFQLDGCHPTVVEPPLHMLSMMRRVNGTYQGLLAPGDGRVWTLTPEDVDAHLCACGESHYLGTLGSKFTHVPEGRKARKKVVQEVSKPDCALGSVALAADAAGFLALAERAREQLDKSLDAPDRIVYAQQIAEQLRFSTPKVKVKCALEIGVLDCITLVKLKDVDGSTRTHSLCVYNGMIYDTGAKEALRLTRENLTTCLGAEYGAIVRGYHFMPSGKTKRSLPMELPQSKR